MRELQKGDKIKILGKSIGCSLEDSKVYREGNGIGYVTNAKESWHGRKCVAVHWRENRFTGDFFAYRDIELYDDPVEVINSMFDDLIDGL